MLLIFWLSRVTITFLIFDYKYQPEYTYKWQLHHIKLDLKIKIEDMFLTSVVAFPFEIKIYVLSICCTDKHHNVNTNLLKLNVQYTVKYLPVRMEKLLNLVHYSMSQYSCMNHSSFTGILSSFTWMSSIQCNNRSMSCDQLSTNQVPAVSMSLLNFQSWRHMGHNWLTCWEFSHLTMQWMWKQWEHSPQTERQVQNLAQRHQWKHTNNKRAKAQRINWKLQLQNLNISPH